jgi:hypothetical protein
MENEIGEVKLQRYGAGKGSGIPYWYTLSYRDAHILVFYPEHLPRDEALREITLHFVKELLFLVMKELEEKSQ